MCDDSTVVASVNLRGRTVSRFLCSLNGRLIGWSECLGIHLNLVICQGSPLFWRISSAVGFRLRGQRGLSTCRWRPLFCVPGAFRRWVCSRRVSPRCFPYSVPSSRIPRWSSWLLFAFIWAAWVCMLSSFLSSDAGWLESERPHSLQDSGPPPLTGVGVVRDPSPTLLVVFLVSFCRDKVCQSRQFRALSQPLTLSWPCRTGFARSFVDFHRNFAVPFEPAELCSTPVVVTLFPQGLAQGLCVPFGLRLSVFLPNHCSSSRPFPRLESPAHSTSFVSSLSLQS